MTFLNRIAPDSIRNSLSSLSSTALRHRRPLRVTAAAVLAVAAVVTPVAVQAANASPASHSSSADGIAAQLSFTSLASAKLTADQVKGRADLTQLKAAISALENNYSSDPAVLTKLSNAADSAVVLAKATAAGYDAGAQIAQAAADKAAAEAAAKAAAEAAAKAAAEAQAKAAADAAAASTSSSSSYSSTASVAVSPGSAQAIAKSMAAGSYGWGDDQFSCLVSLWNRESGWSTTAGNPSGAYGIPQALPGSKMASAGPNWQTDASTQIAWGLGYINGSYGSPCAAWGHSQSTGWY
ncbi:aggregation-promoting factor C-terminal-like domain-containing protein [Rathayibacter sp. CAU 1779]